MTFTTGKRATRAAAVAEYGLILGLISAVSIGAVRSLGEQVDFNYLVGALETSQINDPFQNFLDNGDFNDVTGMTPTSWGFSASNVAGWTETSGNNLNFEYHNSGWQGVDSINGSFWLDTNESPGGLVIEQDVAGLKEDLVYKITLFAADRDSDLDGSADIYWNGLLKGTLDPDEEDVMQDFTFFIREGEGNGLNRVTIADTGSNDANGISLDKVRVYGPGE